MPIGAPRGFADQGASPQFVEWEVCVDSARTVEVAIGKAVENVADVDPADPTSRVRVTHDVDRAAVGTIRGSRFG